MTEAPPLWGAPHGTGSCGLRAPGKCCKGPQAFLQPRPAPAAWLALPYVCGERPETLRRVALCSRRIRTAGTPKPPMPDPSGTWRRPPCWRTGHSPGACPPPCLAVWFLPRHWQNAWGTGSSSFGRRERPLAGPQGERGSEPRTGIPWNCAAPSRPGTRASLRENQEEESCPWTVRAHRASSALGGTRCGDTRLDGERAPARPRGPSPSSPARGGPARPFGAQRPARGEGRTSVP